MALTFTLHPHIENPFNGKKPIHALAIKSDCLSELNKFQYNLNRLKQLLTQKREAQTILDACTVGSWGTNNEPPYTEQQALKAKEAYDEAVSGIERIIDEL